MKSAVVSLTVVIRFDDNGIDTLEQQAHDRFADQMVGDGIELDGLTISVGSISDFVETSFG